MIFSDLRDWLQAVDAMGELARVSGATWQQEIGALTSLGQRQVGSPALLFDDIPGYPKGYRVLGNSGMSLARVALSLNMPANSSSLDIIRNWRAFLRDQRTLPPRLVTDGPMLENVHQGDAVNLDEFPTPVWHQDDGGRYIGTGCIVVTRDPDTGWVNCGAYRIQVHDRRRVGVWMIRGKHGAMMREKYWQRGKPMPVAISVGHDPLHLMVGGMEIPLGVSEYDYVGGIRGQAVDVVATPLHGLPVPATSEIVLEGELHQGDTLPEGPFGEWVGYYASGARDAPFMEVQGVCHRNDPILLGASPEPPPSDTNLYRCPLRAAVVWDQLEQAGIPGVQAVWAHPVGGSRLLLIVAIKQLYAGHSRQAGIVASQCHAGAYVNKAVVVVDDDVDVFDTNKVIWAVLTRTDPASSVEVLHRCWTSAVDPTAYPQGGLYNNRVVIDACRPWERRDTFPPPIRLSADLAARVRDRWPEVVERFSGHR